MRKGNRESAGFNDRFGGGDVGRDSEYAAEESAMRGPRPWSDARGGAVGGGGRQPGQFGYGGAMGGAYGVRPPDPERPNHAGRGPKNYRRTDQRIAEDVCERLTHHPDIDASEVEVSVHDGEVRLSGHVDDRRTKWLAEELAADVTGVADVRNELRVQGAGGGRPGRESAVDPAREVGPTTAHAHDEPAIDPETGKPPRGSAGGARNGG